MIHSVQSAHGEGQGRANLETVSCPPAFLEYAWYAHLFYSMLGGVWGITVPAVDGVLWMLIAVACFLSVGVQNSQLYRPIAWALCTGVLVLVMQVVFHSWNPRVETVSVDFVAWIATLITVQSLFLRPGFLQRFALVAFAIGLASLPYIQVREVGGVMRAWAKGTAISTPNVLGMWFGFCTVYFVFQGFQYQKQMLRIASWTAAAVSFYIVLIAVSRGPLLAVALACLVGFRSALKGSFVPLATFACLTFLVYLSGVFDEWFDYFLKRGVEESGRDKLWPEALARIERAPWLGYGLDNVGILEVRRQRVMNPHNPLLHLALGVGIIPVICFLGYLVRAAMGSFHIMRTVHAGEAMLIPPLVVYGLCEIMLLDRAFMLSWVVVAFGLAARANLMNDRQGFMISPRTDAFNRG